MRNKALSIFLIFLSFVALATVASAGKETQLTNGERLTLRTSIYGNYVFWTEITANDVHAFDLTTGKRIDIHGHVVVDKINAYGSKVVWTGDDGDAVYMYDISTGNETKIASGRRLPDIYGNHIVYTNNYYGDLAHANGSVYLYDLNAHKETKIANVYSFPAIYDTKVVWSQANSNGTDICEYDISTNQTSIITTTNTSVTGLDIYGNNIVWRTGVDGDSGGDVYVYNTATHNKTQVTKDENVIEFAIYGKRVVYTYSNVYMYDISTAKTTQITTSNSTLGPSIYGDKIAYADWRNYPETEEIRDIYLYDLHPENEKLKAIFTTSATSGEAPLTVSFSDVSSGIPNAWYWDFGDGTNSTQQNTSHTYLSAGNYTAHLRVSDANGTDSTSATINVLKPVPLVANFSTNVSKGYAPLTVQFTDLSENAKDWQWSFGDETLYNNNPWQDPMHWQQNPMHTYYSAGNYTVNLTVGNYKPITNNYFINRTSATITVLEKPMPTT
jgi:beta propeller repeat protein